MVKTKNIYNCTGDSHTFNQHCMLERPTPRLIDHFDLDLAVRRIGAKSGVSRPAIKAGPWSWSL